MLATADDIIITNGFQQALDVIARVLLEPGDRVAVEDPGYPPPRGLLATMGMDVVAVPVDDEGIVVDAIPGGVRAVLVTPSHQFPLGHTMSLRRRLALLRWAEREDAAIVEDDYDSEFRFGGRPIEPLQRLDGSGRVLYTGSFSKTMLPSLRLGFIVTPASLRPRCGPPSTSPTGRRRRPNSSPSPSSSTGDGSPVTCERCGRCTASVTS